MNESSKSVCWLVGVSFLLCRSVHPASLVYCGIWYMNIHSICPVIAGRQHPTSCQMSSHRYTFSLSQIKINKELANVTTLPYNIV
jgi:hypothetical protein